MPRPGVLQGQADLTRVASAGLRDVALIHGLSAGHTPRLVLRKERMHFRAQAGMAPLPRILSPQICSPAPLRAAPRPDLGSAPPLLAAPPSTARTPRPSPSPLAFSSPQAPPIQFARLQLIRSSAAGSLLAPPPSPSPCSGDSRARRCTWRRESGCTSCNSSRPLGCTPEGRGEKGREPGEPGRSPPRSSPAPSSEFPGCQRAQAAHLHRTAIALLPCLHEAVSALRGVQQLDGAVCQESDWDPPRASLPRSPPVGWYLEGLVEEAAPAALLQKLVVLIDAAARELAGQVEPGRARGADAMGPGPRLPFQLSPFSRLGMGCTGDSVTPSRRLRTSVHGGCTEILPPAGPLPARPPGVRSCSARREQGFGAAQWRQWALQPG